MLAEDFRYASIRFHRDTECTVPRSCDKRREQHVRVLYDLYKRGCRLQGADGINPLLPSAVAKILRLFTRADGSRNGSEMVTWQSIAMFSNAVVACGSMLFGACMRQANASVVAARHCHFPPYGLNVKNMIL